MYDFEQSRSTGTSLHASRFGLRALAWAVFAVVPIVCSPASGQTYSITASGTASSPSLVGLADHGTPFASHDISGSTVTLKASYTGATFDSSWPSDGSLLPTSPTGVKVNSFQSSSGVNLTGFGGSADIKNLAFSYTEAGVEGYDQYSYFVFIGGDPFGNGPSAYGNFTISIDSIQAQLTYTNSGSSTVTIANSPSGTAALFVSALESTNSGGPGSVDCSILSALADESGSLYCGVASSSPPQQIALQTLTIQRAPITCGDERDALVAEYSNPSYVSVTRVPLCTDFTQTASTDNFSYSQLSINNNYDWSLLGYQMMVPLTYGYGLDAWIQEIGSVRTVTSAFRSPSHNASIGGATNSQHMFGTAVDIQNVSQTVAEYKQLAMDATLANANFIEKTSGPCALKCVHADWRYHLGMFAP